MSNAHQSGIRSASWNHPPSHVSRIPQTPHSLPQRPVSESFSLAGRHRTNDTAPARSSPLHNTLSADTTSDDGVDVLMSEPDGSVFNSSGPSTPLTRFARNLKNAGQQSPVRQNLLERRHSMQVIANRQRVISNFYNSTGHTPPSYHQPNPNAPPPVVPNVPPSLKQISRFTPSQHLRPAPPASPYNHPQAHAGGFPNNPPVFSNDTNIQTPTPSPAHHSTPRPSRTHIPIHQQHLRPTQPTAQQLAHQQQINLQHAQQAAQAFAQAQQAREQQIHSEFRKAESLQLPPPPVYICSLCDLQFAKSVECIEPDELGRAYCEECVVKCATRVVNEQKVMIAEEGWAEAEGNRVGEDVEMDGAVVGGGMQHVPVMAVGGDGGDGGHGEVRIDVDGHAQDGELHTDVGGEAPASELRVDVGGQEVDGEMHADAGGQDPDGGNMQTAMPVVAGPASLGADAWDGVEFDDDFGFDYDAYFKGSKPPQGSD